MVVGSWLERAAASAPASVAVETPHGSCSYAELHTRARAGAAELAARGARRGEYVAIALPAGLDFASALHACLLGGLVAVPVDLRLGERERAAVVDGAAVVVDEPLPVDGARGGRGSPPAGATPMAGATHDLDAVAAVIHTSGTTSAPRPVELTYGNFLWSALGSAVALGVDPRERWLCNLPLSHIGGLSILLRSAIYGTAAVVHERFDVELTLAALRGDPGMWATQAPSKSVDPKPVTVVSLVATTLARLLDAGLARPPALRCALTGGGPVPPALLARARAAGVPVSLTYGLTEACSQVSTLPLAALAPGLAGRPQTVAVATAGRPLSHARARVALDGEIEVADPTAAAATAGPPLFCTRVRIAPGGEIHVAGPTVARGAADPDGWLHTGDLGNLTAEGSLQVTGRKADTIVTGGENVAPAEVEGVLEEHPGVLEAAVLARPDEHWGEAVTALVVARAGAVTDEARLRAHCAARLAPYKVPKRVVVVEGPLPRTRSGKLLRRELG